MVRGHAGPVRGGVVVPDHDAIDSESAGRADTVAGVRRQEPVGVDAHPQISAASEQTIAVVWAAAGTHSPNQHARNASEKTAAGGGGEHDP